MTGPRNDPRPKFTGSNDGPSGAEFAGIGLQFVIAMLGGLYAGQWLDGKLGTAPWLLIVGVFSGAGLSFYSMYRKLMAAQAKDDEARKARREGRE
jgi:ATP synthase protein I